jgi:hypothetical protein
MVLAGLGSAQAQSHGLNADAASLLQPDAGVVLGVDLKRILASPAASLLRSQMEESGLRMTAMKGMTDWDRLGIDIEQMLVSVSAKEVARTGKLTPGAAGIEGAVQPRRDTEAVARADCRND